nr:MAG: hypothetical protein J07AB56_03400 [Candidatus Nanosalinarum sp. J07AB56]
MRKQREKGDGFKLWVTDAEIADLRRAAGSRRDDLIIQLGAFVGLRAFEIPQVTPGHVRRVDDGDHYRLRVPAGKDTKTGKGEPRNAYLPARVELCTSSPETRGWVSNPPVNGWAGLAGGLPRFVLHKRKAPRPFVSQNGLSQAASSRGVRGTRSVSPTSGQADRLPVSPTASGPARRVLPFSVKSNTDYALPPTAQAVGFRAVTAVM